MTAKQLSIWDIDQYEKFKIKEIILKNYKRIHGEYKLKLSPGINIITPNYDDKDYEITETECDIDFNPYEQHVDTLCQNDIIEMINLFKNNKNFGLWDYSFFADNKYISVGAILEKDKQEIYFERRKRYRGKEQIGEVIINDNTTKFKKINNNIEKMNEFKKIVNKIAIYPDEAPIFLRVKYTKNFYHILQRYPLIDIKTFVSDINELCFKYDIGCKLEIETNKVDIKNINNYNDTLLELAMIIALEKQIKNSVVIISHRFGLNYIYDNNLDKALKMLEEFVFQKQQVIVLYDNPYNIWDWQRVKYNVDFINKIRGIKNYYKMVWFNEKYKKDEDWNNVTIKIAARELIERQELDLNDKIRVSKRIIRDALLKCKKPAIACSFGKDSMVLVDLVMKTYDELKNNCKNFETKRPVIIFCNTGVEFPEHIKFAKEQIEIFKNKGWKYHEEKPDTNFFKIVEKYGFPMFGKAIRPNKNPKLYNKIKELGIRFAGNKCCEELKEKVSNRVYKKLDIDMVFTGILASESENRRYRWYDLRDIYYSKTQETYKSVPIIHFKDEDIWEYIKRYNIPTSPLYSMGYEYEDPKTGEIKKICYTRTGCWPCAMQIKYKHNNIELLRHTHPHLWKLIMVKKGLAKEILKFKKGWSEDKWNETADIILKQYLETKPCHFDII